MKTWYKLSATVLLGSCLCVLPARALVPIMDMEQASLTLSNIATISAQKAIQTAIMATGVDTILAMGEAGLKATGNLMDTAGSMTDQAIEVKDKATEMTPTEENNNETQDKAGWSS